MRVWRPDVFHSATAFFAEIRTRAPALVILDLALGETDAVDVIRQLEILKYKGDVLLVSGRDQTVLRDVEQIGKTHGLAMLPPLQKPFRLADLKASVQAVPGIPAKPVELPAPAEAAIDLATALNDNRLEVWYQPKIDLKTRMVCGAEGLLRVRHPTGGQIVARRFSASGPRSHSSAIDAIYAAAGPRRLGPLRRSAAILEAHRQYSGVRLVRARLRSCRARVGTNACKIPRA